MNARTLSTKVDGPAAERLREIAEREHTTVSDVVAAAALVYPDLPKELRDALLEIKASGDAGALGAIAEDMKALAARYRFDMAERRLVEQRRFGGDAAADDFELLEEATRFARDG